MELDFDSNNKHISNNSDNSEHNSNLDPESGKIK